MKTAEILAPSGIENIYKYLTTSPTDELYTALELSRMYDVPRSTIQYSRILDEYVVVYNGNRYFGSRLAKKTFLRQINEK